MKKWIALILCLLIPVCGALADQQIQLPGEHYSLTLPDGMQYSPKNNKDQKQSPNFQYAYFSGTLEMDVFQYAGGGVTLKKVAESMQEKGHSVSIQSVNGLELLCYTDVVDDADGASCIGYVLMDGDQVIELAFWYATQDAMKQTETIISSIR